MIVWFDGVVIGRVAVRPQLKISGIVAEESTMFTSKLMPLLLCFNTPESPSPHLKVLCRCVVVVLMLLCCGFILCCCVIHRE